MTFEELQEQFAIGHGYAGWHEIEDDHKLGDVCVQFAKFCLIENIVQSQNTIEVSEELISEAKEVLGLPYIKNGVDAVPDWMKNQKKLVSWAAKMAFLVSSFE